MKFDNTQVMNFDGAIRGMRNPHESWNKSDSYWDESANINFYSLGPNDLALMQRLIKAGTDHRKFMRQIFVCVDITAPLYWWKEFDTYKVGTVANSTSTMHKLATTPITEQCFEIDLNTLNGELNASEMWGTTITNMELIRQKYLETKDKKYWKLLIQLLPESWLQKRTVTLNYENLVSIAHSARKVHKLTEWKDDFFNWMHTLPYAEELIFID